MIDVSNLLPQTAHENIYGVTPYFDNTLSLCNALAVYVTVLRRVLELFLGLRTKLTANATTAQTTKNYKRNFFSIRGKLAIYHHLEVAFSHYCT